MRAPSEAHNYQLVRIRPGQSVANSPELNFTASKVTNLLKLRE